MDDQVTTEEHAMSDTSKELAKDAAITAAFTTDTGRQLVHCFTGFMGADWDLVDVLTEIDTAEQVAFGPDLMGHHLRVVGGDGRLRRFDVPMPVSTDE